jgi:hypothetical protein
MTSVTGRRRSASFRVVVMNSQNGASFSTTFVSSSFADDDDAYAAPRRGLVDRTRDDDGDARVAIARATNRALVARNIRPSYSTVK